jgi:hypothetical protein
MGNLAVIPVSGRRSPKLSSARAHGRRSPDLNVEIRSVVEEIRSSVGRIQATLDRLDELLAEPARAAGAERRTVRIRHGGGPSLLVPNTTDLLRACEQAVTDSPPTREAGAA